MINQVLVRQLLDDRFRIQRDRIRCGNRISAILRGSDTADQRVLEYLYEQHQRLLEDEQRATERLLDELDGVPILDAACGVKGIGRVLAAQVIAEIGDIGRFPTVSKLWRYSGYGLAPYWVNKDGRVMAPKVGRKWERVDGKLISVKAEVQPEEGWELKVIPDRKVKGFLLPYNSRLKHIIHIVAQSLLKSNSPYREIYDDAIASYSPGLRRIVRHMRAMRKMKKIWLSHLWEVWRRLEGLPVRKAWIFEHGGHQDYLDPQAFGWLID